MKKNTLANIFLLIMCIVFFFTCTQDNDDALGPSPHPDLIPSNAFDSTPPDNATIVSPDTFSSMLDDESLTLVTMNQIVITSQTSWIDIHLSLIL